MIMLILRPNLQSEKIVVENGSSLVYIFFLNQSGNQDLTLEFILRDNNTNIKIFGFIIGNNGKSILRISVNHHGPNTASRVWMKSVLDGNAESKIHGLIRVEKTAQGADGYFTHNTLLLSKNVREKTSPTLEIEANEVRVSHSATISNFDPETLFYFNSRGIRMDAAKRLVIASFIKEPLAEISDVDMRKNCEDLIEEKLGLLS